VKDKQLELNDNQEKLSKNQKKPYKSPTLIQYGTVAKLTQGTRSRGKETRRRIA
jgi:hypothetical protein